MKKKLLTLEDLVKFCKAQKLYSFSSKETGEQICVQVPASFAKENTEGSLLYATVKSFHTLRNRNGSAVTEKAANKSLSTFAYKPILAAFTKDKDGNDDFMSHEMEIDDDGNIVYIEQQVGCFTTDEPYMEKEPDDDRQFVYARCAIPREYTKAADIIERKGGTKVSVELIVNEFSYDEGEDVLLLEDIEVSGLTLLGVNEDGEEVLEGMEGARLDIKDFSKSNNSVLNEDIKQFIQESIKEALDNNSQRKEENQMSHFEELLEKYGKTVEEITFAYEGLSDEELDAAFSQAFEEASEPENTEPEETLSEETEEFSVEYSVTYDGETRHFAKSLNDKIREITDLVNATYGAEDNAFYDCEIFDETKTVLFHDWWNGKHFRQKYGTKEGNLALKGERTEVFVRYLSEDELAALDELNSKFEAISKEFETAKAELDLYKSEPEKVEMLNSDDYGSIRETAEFEELSKRENYFSLTKEELEGKLNDMLVNFAKQYGKENAEQAPIGVKRFGFAPTPAKTSRYGNTFSKEN